MTDDPTVLRIAAFISQTIPTPRPPTPKPQKSFAGLAAGRYVENTMHFYGYHTGFAPIGSLWLVTEADNLGVTLQLVWASKYQRQLPLGLHHNVAVKKVRKKRLTTEPPRAMLGETLRMEDREWRNKLVTVRKATAAKRLAGGSKAARATSSTTSRTTAAPSGRRT